MLFQTIFQVSTSFSFFSFFGMSITYKIFGIKLLIFTGTVRRFLEKYVDDVDSVIFVCNEDTVVRNALFIVSTECIFV